MCQLSNVCKRSSYQVIINDFGKPNEVLEGVYVEVPNKLSSNQILLKVLMSPINPSDINMIEGTYHIKPSLPAVAGNEGVGEILEVGGAVQDHQVGERVIYSVADRSQCQLGAGTWRQFSIVNETNIIKVPSNISLIGAATLAVNPCTAYRMLKDFVKLKTDDVIIQNGSNSAVGQYIIQLCKYWGIKTINIIRGRQEDEKEQLVGHLQNLGADIILTEEDRKKGALKDILKSLPEKPKLALNCVGGDSSAHLVNSLRQKGVIVTYGGMSKRPVMIPTGAAIFKQITAHGYWNTEWMKDYKNSPERMEMITELCDYLDKGIIKTPKAELFYIKDFKTAVSESLKEFKTSKKVLVMDETLKC
ncbi:hypothetical protein LOTGIDRAFT_119678 [Lottia gigantea]|uniref:Enoyl-[acyl-carrier-protein] reductase, mitochondrial n=1 Tax=Lottia gigantea TaxID=225164 RepID=V4A961_LOTGI|nr:hypothetical protein LOTGIDRAFT_119678 [Lottia gigantea]ESO93307.1 hypothetical protein LOTGIDRAFT_119678 [Lottia gigantea]